MEEGRGVYPRLFYDKTGNEVDAMGEGAAIQSDPRERFMDRSDAALGGFNREVDLDK